jgi:hypothetical protein
MTVSTAPSVHREHAQLLVEGGIDCISMNIDAVDRARRPVAAAGGASWSTPRGRPVRSSHG